MKKPPCVQGIKIQIIQDSTVGEPVMSEMVYLGLRILSLVEKHKLDEVYNHPDLKMC